MLDRASNFSDVPQSMDIFLYDMVSCFRFRRTGVLVCLSDSEHGTIESNLAYADGRSELLTQICAIWDNMGLSLDQFQYTLAR